MRSAASPTAASARVTHCGRDVSAPRTKTYCALRDPARSCCCCDAYFQPAMEVSVSDFPVFGSVIFTICLHTSFVYNPIGFVSINTLRYCVFTIVKKERKLILPIGASIDGSPPDLMLLPGHQRKPVLPGWCCMRRKPYRQERGGTRITDTRPGVGRKWAVFGFAGREHRARGIPACSGDHGFHLRI